MKTLVTMIFSVCFIGTALAQQPNEMPKPGPEMQKYAASYCGEYTYSGKAYTTPLGPAGEVTGRMVARPILNGFALEALYDHKGPGGETQSREISWYDAATKKYFYVFISNNGYLERAPFTLSEDVASWEGTCVSDGKRYKIRGTDTDLPDGTGFIRKGEISVDGKTWLTVDESKYVKVKEAASGSTSVKQELKRLETEAWNAVTKVDIATIDRILADEFIGIYDNDDEASDPIWTKDFLISSVRSGKYVCTSIKYDDLKVRIDGNAAAVSGVTTTKETFDGQDMSGRFRFTSTWIKKPTGWKCVGDRAVRIADTTAKGTSSPKTEINKTVFRRLLAEVTNDQKMHSAEEILHKDFVFHGPGGRDVRGIEAFKNDLTYLRSIFPDYHETEEVTIAEGDFIASRWTSTGTHSKNGKKFRMSNMTMDRFKDGKIIEIWWLCDSESRKKQLGLDKIFGGE